MNKTLKKVLISIALVVIVGGITFYTTLPALNVYSKGFWTFLVWIIALAVAPFLFSKKNKTIKSNDSQKTYLNLDVLSVNKKLLIALALPIAVIIIGSVSSMPLFRAKSYASIIDVKEAVFEEDMPEVNGVSNIALMDSQSAVIIGNRALGNLSDVVSQYQASSTYNQINYKDSPQKVSPLEYADFFKWINNRSAGIPGYIMVDPVNNTAKYITLENPIHYSSSGYFGDYLTRALRFEYPTKIFGSISFEIDENGNPFYIVSCMKPKVGLFGGLDVNEVIIFNPCDKSSVLYDVSEVPSWVDIVYTGHLASEKYNWYGTLSGGYWNSVIGNKGCKKTTDDFGYIALDDDVWYFTGVTSVVADESNIGFILTNARTSEYKYYPVVGAEEYSAMRAAEGEVQEKGYVASFPSLINVSGEATYIMVLKDSGGLVKLYALVNVEQYNIVGTGATQEDAISSYKKLLAQNGIIGGNIDVESDIKTKNITVSQVRIVQYPEDVLVYISSVEERTVYSGSIYADEALILINEGDTIAVSYKDTDNDMIKNIASWEFVDTAPDDEPSDNIPSAPETENE